ncbi:hypothetical protein TMatcc_008208 [Talaromyces marneffei ATCC 18224]
MLGNSSISTLIHYCLDATLTPNRRLCKHYFRSVGSVTYNSRFVHTKTLQPKSVRENDSNCVNCVRISSSDAST